MYMSQSKSYMSNCFTTFNYLNYIIQLGIFLYAEVNVSLDILIRVGDAWKLYSKQYDRLFNQYKLNYYVFHNNCHGGSNIKSH